MNTNELLNNPKELANSQDLLRDLIQGDPYALKRFENLNLDINAIKTALKFITDNDKLSQEDKAKLLQDSWKINFRSKPPTPEEFLSEKYLGYTAVSLYPRVQNAFKEFLNPTAAYRNLILYPHIGWGKLVLNTCIIYTYEGPKLVKDIKVGDVICTPDGKTANVINKQNYPDAPIYKVTFSDGRTSYVGGPHFWKAAYSHNTKKWNSEKKVYDKCKPEPCWKIITTEKIVEDMKEHPNHGWFIPLTKPVIHKKKNHIIPPYTLGALLGDGCLKSSSPYIVNNDKEVFDHIIREANTTKYKAVFKDLREKNRSTDYIVYLKKEGLPKNFLIEELRRLRLFNTCSFTKFIPDEYLYDSIENRIALLQGLMDTDGTVENVGPKAKASNRRAHPSFWTTSEKLKDDILTLIYGLGGTAKWSKRTKGNSGTKNQDAYVIYFNFPENNFPIFSLERKQKYIDEEYEREKEYKEKRKPQALYIKSIEKTDLKGGACIETDDEERLFLTDNYIVTHNSFLSTLVTLYLDTCVSLMRNPAKYFGVSQATSFSSMLISYSLKKSSELLVAPFLNILESSPFFEKVTRREAMQDLVKEYQLSDKPVEKLYYTTAAKDKSSVLEFDSGLSVKVASSPQALLGLTLVSATFSELAFFTDAGKALDLNERVLMADGSSKPIKDVKVGDILLHPYSKTSIIESIPWEGKDDLYEIEVEDGRTVKCNKNHMWPVKYKDDKGLMHQTTVDTKFMIDHLEFEFDLLSI